MTFTNKQKHTKHQENTHTPKYTIHKPLKQQNKITDRIQTPQWILEGFKAPGGPEKRPIKNKQTFLISQIKMRCCKRLGTFQINNFRHF